MEGQIYLLDGLREPVRLGAGLTRDRRLDRPTQLRALETLARFGERLRGFERGAVRAVGTNTLRVARNAERFLEEAEQALGFPIEVVFGREEARLIYIGVAHALPPRAERRLVVDVGGGSTEFIIGTGLDPELMESVTMGCVSYSLQFFPEGRLDKPSFKRAETAAANELQRLVRSYRRAGWSQAIASSGTAKCVAGILASEGWSERGLTPEGLERLRASLIKAGDITRVRFAGLKEDRLQVLPGGVAILSAVLSELAVETMDVSEGALRDGVLYDLLGRAQHHDLREATVSHFQRRYQLDLGQCDRVATLAGRISEQLGPMDEDDAQMLRWAAALHETGISIAFASYHRHSSYILSQADMPGFSQGEQRRLARLVLAHRGKLSKVELEDLPSDSPDWGLIFALRLAALLSRSRIDVGMPPMECSMNRAGFRVAIPGGWLDGHPLTEAALENEAEEWRAVGLKLEIARVSDARARAGG